MNWLEKWGTIFVGGVVWFILNPASASPHSQTLYICLYSWIGLKWCKKRLSEIGTLLDIIGSRSAKDEIQLRAGVMYRLVTASQFEWCSITLARNALLCIPLLFIGIVWAVLQVSWFWTFGCFIGLVLDNDLLAPHLRDLGCYLLVPWLVVASHRLCFSVYRYKRLCSLIDNWFAATSLPRDHEHISPIPLPFKCIRISLNKSVLFCLLLVKAVVWMGLKGVANTIIGFFNFPSRLRQLYRYLNQQDYNQLLVEAMDLLKETMSDVELTWLHFRHWREILQEPLDLTSNDYIAVCSLSRGSLDDYCAFPSVHASVDQREFDLGWRIRRQFRSVGKLVDKRLSRVENEAHILSSLWSNVKSERDEVVEDTNRGTYWDFALPFFSSFNPALNGIQLLGNERLIKHQLKFIAAPNKVSVDLRWGYENILRYAID